LGLVARLRVTWLRLELLLAASVAGSIAPGIDGQPVNPKC
jgi:hypothetical protein